MHQLRPDPITPKRLQLFIIAKRRLPKQPVRQIQNLLRAPIIDLQLVRLGIRHHVRKRMNRLEIRPAKRVNTLCIIPHTKQPAILRKRRQQLILQRIRILHLIHQNMIPSPRHLPANHLIPLQAKRHHTQQIIIIHILTRLLILDILLNNRRNHRPILLHRLRNRLIVQKLMLIPNLPNRLR